MDPITRRLVETVLQITENTSDVNTGGFVKALALKKEKENTAAKAGQIQESGYIPDDTAIAKVMGPNADYLEKQHFTDFLRQNHAYFFTGPEQPLDMAAAHDEFQRRRASGKPTFITPAAIPSRPVK